MIGDLSYSRGRSRSQNVVCPEELMGDETGDSPLASYLVMSRMIYIMILVKVAQL